MVVFVIQNSNHKLRGELTKWLIEVMHGTFVGDVTKTVREKLWEKIKDDRVRRGAVMIYNYPCVQGFRMEMCGRPRRKVVDFDGIQLIFVTNFKDAVEEIKTNHNVLKDDFCRDDEVLILDDVEKLMLEDEKWKDSLDDNDIDEGDNG